MGFSLRNFSIRKKLVIIISLTAFMALLFVASTIALHEYIVRKQQTEQQLASLAEMLSWNSSSALAFVDYKTADETLDVLKTQPGIVAAFLYDNEGKRVADYQTRFEVDAKIYDQGVLRWVDANSKQNKVATASNMDGSWASVRKRLIALGLLEPTAGAGKSFLYDRFNQLHLFHAISVEGQPVGVLELVDDLSGLDSFLQNFYRIIALIFGVTLVLILLGVGPTTACVLRALVSPDACDECSGLKTRIMPRA